MKGASAPFFIGFSETRLQARGAFFVGRGDVQLSAWWIVEINGGVTGLASIQFACDCLAPAWWNPVRHAVESLDQPKSFGLPRVADILQSCGIPLNVAFTMSLPVSKKSSLPVVVTEMRALLGDVKTQAMVTAFGGQRIRIPATPASAMFSEIAKAIGPEGAGQLHKAYGRGLLYIPKLESLERARRNERIRQRFDELTRDMSSRKAVSLMVQEFGLSDRQIETIVNS